MMSGSAPAPDTADVGMAESGADGAAVGVIHTRRGSCSTLVIIKVGDTPSVQRVLVVPRREGGFDQKRVKKDRKAAPR